MNVNLAIRSARNGMIIGSHSSYTASKNHPRVNTDVHNLLSAIREDADGEVMLYDKRRQAQLHLGPELWAKANKTLAKESTAKLKRPLLNAAAGLKDVYMYVSEEEKRWAKTAPTKDEVLQSMGRWAVRPYLLYVPASHSWGRYMRLARIIDKAPRIVGTALKGWEYIGSHLAACPELAADLRDAKQPSVALLMGSAFDLPGTDLPQLDAGGK